MSQPNGIDSFIIVVVLGSPEVPLKIAAATSIGKKTDFQNGSPSGSIGLYIVGLTSLCAALTLASLSLKSSSIIVMVMVDNSCPG